MTDADKSLAELTRARADFKNFVRAVDADLAKERERRLFAETARIHDWIVQAYAEGASLAEIKRAYGTKDHRTIRSIIDNAAAEIRERQRRQAEAAHSKFRIEGQDVIITEDEVALSFEIVELEEDDAIMLIARAAEHAASHWDALVLDASSKDEEGLLYDMLVEAGFGP